MIATKSGACKPLSSSDESCWSFCHIRLQSPQTILPSLVKNRKVIVNRDVENERINKMSGKRTFVGKLHLNQKETQVAMRQMKDQQTYKLTWCQTL